MISQTDIDAMTETPERQEAVIDVKPLDWIACIDGTHHDRTCSYEVAPSGKYWDVRRGVTGGGSYVCGATSLDGAKAAAERAHRDHILSQIVVRPAALAQMESNDG